MRKREIKRGEIYCAELLGIGNQQTGVRPVIIYSNNKNNEYSPTVNIIPLSTDLRKLCVHVLIEGYGLKEPSMALLEQITTINKTQLRGKIGTISDEDMARVDRAADIQFDRTVSIVKEEVFGAA